jgi:hypothetical protein
MVEFYKRPRLEKERRSFVKDNKKQAKNMKPQNYMSFEFFPAVVQAV